MVQLVDHSSECENMTVLRSRVQFSFMSLFCVCQISHGHVIYNLIWWSKNGSTRNLVGIHLEFGQNDSESKWNLGGFSFLPNSNHSYHSARIPLGFLPFCSESARIHSQSYHSAWICSECVGEGKVDLKKSRKKYHRLETHRSWAPVISIHSDYPFVGRY